MGNLLKSRVVSSCVDMISLIYTIGHSWSASTYWNFLRGSPGGLVEWIANKWCLDKLSPISNDISAWLLQDVSRTITSITIKKLIKVSVSLSISWAITWWQTHRFPCNRVHWPEYLETSFITAAFWCVPSDVSPDVIPCVSAARYQLMYCGVCELLSYECCILWDTAFPSVVQITLCTKFF